jgi:hypothetical protein
MKAYLTFFVRDYLLLIGFLSISIAALLFLRDTNKALSDMEVSLSVLENDVDRLIIENQESYSIGHYFDSFGQYRQRRHPEIPEGMGKVIFWKKGFQCPNDVTVVFNFRRTLPQKITKNYEALPAYGDSTGCVSIIAKPGRYEYMPFEYAYQSYATRRHDPLSRRSSLTLRKEWTDSVTFLPTIILHSGVVEIIEDSCIYIQVHP